MIAAAQLDELSSNLCHGRPLGQRALGAGQETFLPGVQSAFQPLSMRELLSLPDENLEWIWRDYIATGDLALFTAYMKVGKSTLTYPLALAVSRGDDFLERPTKQSGVLILALEEHRRDVVLRFKKLGAVFGDPIYVQSTPLPCNREEVQEIRKFCSANKVGLVIVDSLSAYWEINDENNNAEVQRKLTPLRDFAHTDNVAVLLVHHESKHGGRDRHGETTGDGRSIRGASSLFGLVDQSLSLSRAEGKNKNRRKLRSLGRRSESVPELIIELSGDTRLSSLTSYGYKVVGTPDQLEKVELQKKVESLLTPQWLTIEELAEDGKQIDLNEPQIREALKGLHAAGRARRQGKGAKGSPFEYQLPVANASSAPP